MDFVDLACPDGLKRLGSFRSTSIGEGRSCDEAKSVAYDNCLNDIMNQVPVVICSGDECEALYTLTQTTPILEICWEYLPFTKKQGKFGARATLVVDVEAECVKKGKIRPGGHVVIKPRHSTSSLNRKHLSDRITSIHRARGEEILRLDPQVPDIIEFKNDGGCQWKEEKSEDGTKSFTCTNKSCNSDCIHFPVTVKMPDGKIKVTYWCSCNEPY